MGLRDRGGDPRGRAPLVRGRLGAGAEPSPPGGAPGRARAADGARVSARRRLRDGLRPCLAVFLAARIGLSLLSVVAVDLIEPLDPVDVPGRAAPGRDAGLAQRDRRDRAPGRRLVPAARGRRVVDERRERRVLPAVPAHRARGRVGPSRRRPPRRAPRLEPRVPRRAAGAVRADRRGLRGPRRAAGDRRGGDLPDLLLLPRPLHRVAVPAPVDPRVPGSAPRSVGPRRRLRRSRGPHPERRHPPDPGAPGRGVRVQARPAVAPEASRARRRVAGAAAIALGPLCWFAWWGVAHGNWLAPLDAQRQWGRELQPPWVSLGRAVELAWSFRSYWLLDLVVVSIAIVGLALALPALRASETTYGALGLLLPLFDPFWDRPLLSAPRFAVVVFPALWGLSGVGLGRKLPRAARDLRARRRLGDLRRALRQLAAPVLSPVLKPVLKPGGSEPAAWAGGRMCRARNRPEVP